MAYANCGIRIQSGGKLDRLASSLGLELIVGLVMTEVNPDVKAVVIPIRFVIPAPLACRFHLGDVVLNLGAVIAMAVRIAVNACAVRFQTTVAIVFPILVCASGASECQQHPAR